MHSKTEAQFYPQRASLVGKELFSFPFRATAAVVITEVTKLGKAFY